MLQLGGVAQGHARPNRLVGAGELMAALQRCCGELEVLGVSHCLRLGEEKDGGLASAAALASLLVAAPRLHTLQAGGNGVGGDGLPKPKHLIKAEMGVVIKGERQVLEVSMEDDLSSVVANWCQQRGLAPAAKQKVEKELQSRLDQALAVAMMEAEGGGIAAQAAPPPVAPAPPEGIC